MSELYARKGEQVLCEAGHTICRIAEDLALRSPVSAEVFSEWQVPPPVPGSVLPLTCPCGAPYARGNRGFGVQLFLGGAWRVGALPSEPESPLRPIFGHDADEFARLQRRFESWDFSIGT